MIYQNKHFVLAGENFGGWSFNNSFGWTSESCNNLHGTDYEDYCGLESRPILDINFDSDDVNLDTNIVQDNTGNFTGDLFGSFVSTDIRNGGKNKSNGSVTRDSNFNNSLYFSGNSYIKFGTDFSFDGDDFTISLWFKADPGITSNVFLFSNGDEFDKKYHCWFDSDYYLSCFVKNRKIKTSDPVGVNKWYNVTIVREINTFLMYLNGSLVEESSIEASSIIDPQELILGAFGDYTQNFKGELDEFRFFDRALSVEEVLHNTRHNSNYLLNIESDSGEMDGWAWSSGIGWICFGSSCCLGEEPCTILTPVPYEETPYAQLYWSSQGGDTYPHMIKGWANAVTLNDQDTGWISLQGKNIIPADYDNYGACVSCSFRDEEDGLVMYLKMDEDNGLVAIDSSGFGNNGTLDNFEDPIWISDGQINNCLSFDGIDDFVVIDSGNSEELQIGYSDFTIETWIKNEKITHNSSILPIITGLDTKWKLFVDVDINSIIFEILGVSVQSKLMDMGEWSHIVITGNRDGNLEMYVNNVKVDDANIFDPDVGIVNIENGTILIGADNENLLFWDDKLDIIRIYNRLLDRDEIEHNYEFPEKRFCSACLKQLSETTGINNVCYDCERCEVDQGVTNCETCSSCREYGLVFDTNTANIKGYAWGGSTVSGELVGLGWFKFSPQAGAGLYRSYVSSKYGNIYSRANIGSDYTVVPPIGYFNATYMIQANGHIMNWVSWAYENDNDWLMSSDTGNPLNYEYPKLENNYGNILGNLDYNGLVNGIYGEVVEELPNEFISDYNVCLGDKIYYVQGDVELNEKVGGSNIVYKFKNCVNGSGVVVVDGDLDIQANIKYDENVFAGSSNNLASVAWIVKGDLKISPNVTELAGTFIILGEDNKECGSVLEKPEKECGAIYTCDADESECGRQLQVSGQFLAKNFRFQRTFRSLEGQLREPAEDIIYDGRNIINPPPGLGDVLKALPTWNQIAPY